MRESALPPGPFVPSVVQAVLWGVRYPSFTARAHRRYGPTFTVRVGGLPPSVVTTDRDGIRRLLTGDPLTKRHASDQLKALFGERSLVLLEPVEHLQRRKLLLPSFHGDAVQAYANVIERLAETALAEWRAGDTVEVLPFAQRLALAVILESVFGAPQVSVRNDVRRVLDAMVSLPGSAVAGYFPRLARRSRWNLPAERYWRLRETLDTTLAASIASIRTNGSRDGHAGVVPLLVRLSAAGGDGLDDLELRDELKSLIMAGHEPPATAVAWAAELLAHDRALQARAREAALAADSAYLSALVKEILRLRPPIPVGAARRTTEPFELGAYTIPAGVPILVDAYGVHHDPATYPRPERLIVERFLGGSPDAYAFVPFGGGARRCIGAGFAQLEIRIVLTSILRRFELRPTAARPAAAARRGITLAPANAARVRLAGV